MPRQDRWNAVDALHIAEQALRAVASDLRNPGLLRIEARGHADEALQVLSLQRLARVETALRSIASSLHIRSKFRFAAMLAAEQALETLIEAGVAGQRTKPAPVLVPRSPRPQRRSSNRLAIHPIAPR